MVVAGALVDFLPARPASSLPVHSRGPRAGLRREDSGSKHLGFGGDPTWPGFWLHICPGVTLDKSLLHPELQSSHLKHMGNGSTCEGYHGVKSEPGVWLPEGLVNDG